MQSKKGLEWDYIAVFIIGIIILVILLFIAYKNKTDMSGILERISGWL